MKNTWKELLKKKAHKNLRHELLADNVRSVIIINTP